MDGDRFQEEEIVANVILTMVGGQETTTNLICNGVLTLLRHPTELLRLQNDRSQIPSAIEEMLRFEPPSQYTARVAPYDTELSGKKLLKRQAVISVIAAANRDPSRFVEPDRFDVQRQDNKHLSFGWGAHFCFGAALARMEAQVALEEFLSRFCRCSLDADSLSWRTNLGLRGLTRLPISFSSRIGLSERDN
jgi:cytochrome P450